MNLECLRKSRKPPREGDLFLMKIQGRFLAGRVISTDANPLGVGNGILIYIFSGTVSWGEELPQLGPNDLLVPPIITNRQPWIRGYFETRENKPVAQEERLPVHCFRDSRGLYFNEHGERMDSAREPVGQWGLHSYRTIDDEVSAALGIPLHEDDD